jgi:hypothetical protein
MRRSERSLESLPPELKKDPFWTQSLVKRPTTFGSEPRSFRDFNYDDPYRLEKDIDNWVLLDEHRSNHGRLQVTSTWGKLKVAPPAPSKYDPNHEKLSKREVGPHIKMATKPEDKEYFETVRLAQTYKPPERPTLTPKKTTSSWENRCA